MFSGWADCTSGLLWLSHYCSTALDCEWISELYYAASLLLVNSYVDLFLLPQIGLSLLLATLGLIIMLLAAHLWILRDSFLSKAERLGFLALAIVLAACCYISGHFAGLLYNSLTSDVTLG